MFSDNLRIVRLADISSEISRTPGRKRSYLITETGVFTDRYEINLVSVKRYQGGSF